MEQLDIKHFFDPEHYLVRELFLQHQNVLDVYKNLTTFIENTLKHESLGTIEKGAFVDDNVQLGEGSYIEKNAIIKGPTIIGKNTMVRSGCYVRGHVLIGDNSLIGFGTELHNMMALDNTYFPHHNCIFSSLFGSHINCSGFSTTANMRIDQRNIVIRVPELLKNKSDHYVKINTELSRFGAVVGDDTQFGAYILINPGSIIGKSCMIMPHLSISGWIEAKTVIKDQYHGNK